MRGRKSKLKSVHSETKPSEKDLKCCVIKRKILEKCKKQKSFEMINIFISLQSTMKQLQIFAPQSFETFSRFNLKRSLILVYLVLFAVLLSLCFIPTQTFVESSRVILSTMTGIMAIFVTPVFYWFIPNIFELMGVFKSGIEKRRFQFCLLEKCKS